jgi:hypothetical protein
MRPKLQHYPQDPRDYPWPFPSRVLLNRGACGGSLLLPRSRHEKPQPPTRVRCRTPGHVRGGGTLWRLFKVCGGMWIYQHLSKAAVLNCESWSLKTSPSPKVSIFSATLHRQNRQQDPGVDGMAAVLVPPAPCSTSINTEQYTLRCIVLPSPRQISDWGRQPA